MLDPYKSGLRWAWNRAGQHVKGFTLATVVFSVVAAAVSSIVREPPNPTVLDHFETAGVGVIAGLVFVAVLAFVYALVVAPYEQRNQLRTDLRTERSKVAQLADPILKAMFGTPVLNDDRVWIQLTNHGKIGEFTALASNLKGEGVDYVDPFPVAWEGTEKATVRLDEGEGHNLRVCWLLPIKDQFDSSKQTYRVWFFLPQGGTRFVDPRGNMTVNVEAASSPAEGTKRIRLTLSFSEEPEGFFTFKGLESEALA
jgi:hypothetical protein